MLPVPPGARGQGPAIGMSQQMEDEPRFTGSALGSWVRRRPSLSKQLPGVDSRTFLSHRAAVFLSLISPIPSSPSKTPDIPKPQGQPRRHPTWNVSGHGGKCVLVSLMVGDRRPQGQSPAPQARCAHFLRKIRAGRCWLVYTEPRVQPGESSWGDSHVASLADERATEPDWR